MSWSPELTDFERKCLATRPGLDRLPPGIHETILCAALMEGICEAVAVVNSDSSRRQVHGILMRLRLWHRRRELRRNFRAELERLSRHFDRPVEIVRWKPMGDRSQARDIHPLSFGLQIGGGVTSKVAKGWMVRLGSLGTRRPMVHPAVRGWGRTALWIVYLLIPRGNRQGFWGDLLEDRRDLLKAGVPKWQVNIVCVVEVADMLWRRPWLLRFGGLLGAGLLLEAVRRLMSRP